MTGGHLPVEVIAAIAVALGGVAISGAISLLLTMTDIATPVFFAQLTKLVMAGNRDRATKLSQAAIRAPMGRVAAAVLDAGKRCEGETSEALITETLRSAHERASAAEQQRFRRLIRIAVVGVLIAGGATAWLLGSTVPVAVYGAAPVALLFTASAWRKSVRFAMFDRTLVPKLIDLIASDLARGTS